ncbi:MAG: sigma-54-dependent Fis family transcriptional regulator [Parachlamydiaceae bacterium]|nr:sigma-54-dependent Fis family transcriptional regulator [Parachlamydiaceae bacterium]
MSIEKVLVVDDDMLVRNFLSETLRRKKLDVVTVENGQKAFKALQENTFDLVISDMRLPDTTGIDILTKVKELNPATVVVVITAFGSIENTVEAMRLGAFNYILKPFSADVIEAVIEKAREHISLIEENQYLRQQVSSGGSRSPRKIIGESPAIQKVLADVAQVAQSNASVFITGESGTGKEVIAHAIHYQSKRANKPFIKVNCAAVPDTLVESEFFGHEKGAFTGANAKRLGRFELAHGGSLLLDEVTEIPLALQAKLLRVTQEQEFERVGGTKSVQVDVRLISTSNRNMQEALANKVLREDLFYRLNVVPIHIPPLRERREDIIPLAEYFLERICMDNNREHKTLSNEVKKMLLGYNWPGNIRELANVIERAVVLDPSTQLQADFLHLDSKPGIKISATVGVALEIAEQRLILETMRRYQDNRTKTAEALGISLTTLRNKLNKLDDAE